MFAVCTRCQAALAENELEGLCPRCLMEQAAVPLEWAEGAPTTPPGGFVAPAPARLAPLFGQLEVLELLGQGGMGAVYKARQVKLDRLVALKVLPPAAALGPGFAERFEREARALARLSHPHVIAVYDFGEVQGLYYLVMEYVDGVNLRQAMAEGKLSPPQALALVGQLCSALQYAHETGVVHRDVKPENVLLDRQGRVKVADFGLAKLVGPAQAGRLTGTAQAMGTPHYMAPEQWERPLEVDHRADIYSLGVVFYELLTGELPLGKFAPPSAKAGVDARLDGVVLRAMERQPEQRYQQMSEMKTAVESVEKASAPAAPPLLSPAAQAWITGGMVTLVGLFWAALWVGGDYTVREKFQALATIAALCLVFIWQPTNRYAMRLWALAVFGLIALFAACELTGRPNPLGLNAGCWVWVIALGVGQLAVTRLIASFKPGGGGDGEESPQAAGPVVGLSPRDESLRRLLHAASSAGQCGELWVVPDIDSDLLTATRKCCKAAPDDRILAVLDFSGGEGGAALLFGCEGLYWCNGPLTGHPGPGALSYAAMAGRRFVNHGAVVYLGSDQFICPNEEETGVSAEELTGLLYKVREVTAPAGK
jgi:serine/threonine protein kinase